MFRGIANQTVVRLRGVETTNDYTDTVTDWTTPDRLLIEGCSVQPVPAQEYTLGRDEVLTRWQMWAPADADVGSKDRVEHDGDVYIVDGSVQKWPGRLAHKTCLLRLFEEA